MNSFSFYAPTMIFFINHSISAILLTASANQTYFFNEIPGAYTGYRYMFNFIFSLPLLHIIKQNKVKGILPGVITLLLSYLLVIFIVFGKADDF